MAPRAYEMTAEQRNTIPLLASYQCRLCQKWKGVNMYSRKEQKEWQNRKMINPRVTGDSSAGMRCSGCSGQQVNELICAGQCGLAKSLDEFSKTQRRSGSGWCKECVLWKESADPGLAISAAPNSQLAPDEETKVRKGLKSDSNWDPEDDDSDDDYDYEYEYDYEIPYRQRSSLGGTGGDNTAPASIITDMYESNPAQSRSGGATQASLPLHLRPVGSAYVPGYLPPHLRNDSSAGVGSAYAPSTYGTSIRSQYIPPHLRTAASSRETDIASQSSASNPYATSTQTGGTGWIAIHHRRRDSVQSVPTAAPPPPSLPASESTGAGETGRRGWAKPAGSRRLAPQVAPAPPRRIQQTHYDSDESLDEV